MRRYGYWRLLDGEATGGGGTPGTPALSTAAAPGGTPVLNDFVKSLPTDLQGEKSLHNMDSPVTLAKSYVHAQKMIGTKRLPVPDGSFTEAQWNEVYDGIGRPKSADEYKLPEYKFESQPDLKLAPEKVKAVQQALHKAGLNDRQFQEVIKLYVGQVDGDLKTVKTSAEARRVEAETTLKTEWGDKYDVNMNLAKSVVTKFGDETFMSYINEQGGNDPRLIKSLARIGAAMMEDKSRGGLAADGLQITDQTRASQEIDRLKIDNDFQSAMRNKMNPGHKAAVQRWTNLFKIAHPGQTAE